MHSAVPNKAGLLERIRRHKDEIKSFGVVSMGLFGSFAKNTVTEQSDVDLYVDFDPKKKTFDNFMELAFFLENLLGRKIEIVTPQSLSKHIGPHIPKEVEYVGI